MKELNWEKTLKNNDIEAAKQINDIIWDMTNISSYPYNNVDWKKLANKIGYPHSNMFNNDGVMTSHCRRVFCEIAILSKFGKCFYKNMLKISES